MSGRTFTLNVFRRRLSSFFDFWFVLLILTFGRPHVRTHSSLVVVRRIVLYISLISEPAGN